MAMVARQLLFDLLHHAFLLVLLLVMLDLDGGGGPRGGCGALRVLVLVLPSGDLLLELVFCTVLLPPPALSIVLLRLQASKTLMSVQRDTRALRIDLIQNIELEIECAVIYS